MKTMKNNNIKSLFFILSDFPKSRCKKVEFMRKQRLFLAKSENLIGVNGYLIH
jgi:hypothetical protein